MSRINYEDFSIEELSTLYHRLNMSNQDMYSAYYEDLSLGRELQRQESDVSVAMWRAVRLELSKRGHDPYTPL